MAETIDRATIRNTASASLRLRFQGAITNVVTTTLTVPGLGDRFTLATAPVSAYTWPHEATPDFDNYRRITAFDAAWAAVTINRIHTGSIDGLDLSIYLILTPGDWNEVIDEQLSHLWRTQRVSVTPVDGTSLYSLAGVADWVQSRQQIERLCWRFTPSGSPVYERDIGAYKLINDAGVISLLLEARPDDDEANYTIQLDARRHYDALATDAATTTCPRALILAATKLGALRKIWNIMGDKQAKTLFGEDMIDVEREYVDRSRAFVEQVVHTPIHSEKPPLGPEMAVGDSFGRW